MTEATLARKVLRLLVGTLKGGVTKTTTAILLAIAWAQDGKKVVVICADTTNRGAARWTRRSIDRGYDVPYTFIEWKPELGPLNRFARNVETEHEADVVIVDLGGEKSEFFAYGCAWADWLISPAQPVEAELDGIGPTYESAASISDTRADGLVQSVLMTKVHQVGRGMAARMRKELEEDLRDQTTGRPDRDKPWSVGAHVFETEISRGAGYSDMYGHIPDDVGEYVALRQEIDKLRVEVGV